MNHKHDHPIDAGIRKAVIMPAGGQNDDLNCDGIVNLTNLAEQAAYDVFFIDESIRNSESLYRTRVGITLVIKDLNDLNELTWGVSCLAHSAGCGTTQTLYYSG